MGTAIVIIGVLVGAAILFAAGIIAEAFYDSDKEIQDNNQVDYKRNG